jgi:hypothetical protein
MMQLLHFPRSLTAPDAILPILLLLYLAYKQRSRQKQKGARGNNKTSLKAHYSPFHEVFLTRLSVMVSPSAMASSLHANVVDLHAENKSSKKKPSSASSSGVMEIRTRRIQQGELLSTPQYAIVETAFNLALCGLIGLILRWILGLLRSL